MGNGQWALGIGHASAWDRGRAQRQRGIGDENSRRKRKRPLGLKCGGWANGRAVFTLHPSPTSRIHASTLIAVAGRKARHLPDLLHRRSNIINVSSIDNNPDVM
jgi:hypothetical protein